MGATRGDFIKFPRTPHLFGSKGTDDDKHLSERDSVAFIGDESLIVEEKIDGTNVGIHFANQDQLVLQCRGHLITEGMHPQYDLFKQWCLVRRHSLYERLQERYILFGEWAYAKHTIHYRKLTHFFFEFDIYDKATDNFLTLEDRMQLLDGTGVQTVPVLHRGEIKRKDLEHLIGPSLFDSAFDNPRTGQTDNLMEGLYLRIESPSGVVGRAKMVRPEFVEKITQSTHWQQQIMVPNQLRQGVDIWI
jgi:hypothetical protein